MSSQPSSSQSGSLNDPAKSRTDVNLDLTDPTITGTSSMGSSDTTTGTSNNFGGAYTGTGTGTSTSASGASMQSGRSSSYTDRQNGAGRRSSTNLREDLQNLRQELDTMLSRSSSMSDSELQQEHARIMSNFSSLRYAAKGVAAEAGRQLNRSVDMTSEYVKEKPLQSVAIATGVGMLMAMMLGRR